MSGSKLCMCLLAPAFAAPSPAQPAPADSDLNFLQTIVADMKSVASALPGGLLISGSIY